MIQSRQIKIRNELETLCWSWLWNAVAYQSLVARVGFLIQEHIPEQIKSSSAGLDGPVVLAPAPNRTKNRDYHRYLHAKIPKSHQNFVSKLKKHHPQLPRKILSNSGQPGRWCTAKFHCKPFINDYQIFDKLTVWLSTGKKSRKQWDISLWHMPRLWKIFGAKFQSIVKDKNGFFFSHWCEETGFALSWSVLPGERKLKKNPNQHPWEMTCLNQSLTGIYFFKKGIFPFFFWSGWLLPTVF